MASGPRASARSRAFSCDSVQSQEASVVFVGQQINETIGPLFDVSHSVTQSTQYPFFVNHLPVLDYEANKEFEFQRTH